MWALLDGDTVRVSLTVPPTGDNPEIAEDAPSVVHVLNATDGRARFTYHGTLLVKTPQGWIGRPASNGKADVPQPLELLGADGTLSKRLDPSRKLGDFVVNSGEYLVTDNSDGLLRGYTVDGFTSGSLPLWTKEYYEPQLSGLPAPNASTVGISVCTDTTCTGMVFQAVRLSDGAEAWRSSEQVRGLDDEHVYIETSSAFESRAINDGAVVWSSPIKQGQEMYIAGNRIILSVAGKDRIALER